MLRLVSIGVFPFPLEQAFFKNILNVKSLWSKHWAASYFIKLYTGPGGGQSRHVQSVTHALGRGMSLHTYTHTYLHTKVGIGTTTL